jgi:hypothetical protein
MGSYVVGGSLIAAGVVLLYLNRPRQVEQRSSSAFAGSVTLLPDLADGQIGISVRVRR